MPVPALSAEELYERVRACRGRDLRGLTERQLSLWLLRAGFARQTPAGLAPTELAHQLGGAIDEITRDTGRGR